MPIDPILDTQPAESSGLAYGWDWSATTHDARGTGLSVGQVVESVTSVLGGYHVVPVDKGIHGWTQHLDVFDCDGYRLGRVYYGGERSDVFAVSTSSAADVVRQELVGLGGRTSRVDTRVDTLVPYEALERIMFAAAEIYGSKVRRVESLNPRDGTSEGRTLYLGSPSSAIQVRLYEKWLESPGQYVKGTNRVEVQLRPASKVKERVSLWTRAETFCASRVTQELADRLGAHVVPVNSLHVAKGTPELEASLEAMGNQYGKKTREWLERSGGDLGVVLDYLGVGSGVRIGAASGDATLPGMSSRRTGGVGPRS